MVNSGLVHVTAVPNAFSHVLEPTDARADQR
jgi:hypothetical protein